MSISQLTSLPFWGLGLLSACSSSEINITEGEWVSTVPTFSHEGSDGCGLKPHLESYTYTLGNIDEDEDEDTADSGFNPKMPIAERIAAGKENFWSYCKNHNNRSSFECAGAIELLHNEDWLETGVPIVCPEGTASDITTRSSGFIISSDEILINTSIQGFCGDYEYYEVCEEGSSGWCRSAYSTRLHLKTAAK
jgi:hypothetical protein